MAFSRTVAPTTTPTGDTLTAAMAGIGMGYAEARANEPNIEDTLYFASVEAMEAGDLRVLAMLVAWFGVHHPWINVDRLTRLVSSHESPRVRALWSSMARWQGKDRRYARLARVWTGPAIDALATGSAFQIRRHGEDPRFAGSALRVPANLLRDRPGDVASPAALARQHSAYRHRVIMGPTYRADLWAAFASDPTASAAEVARRAYASFASAWHVRKDFAIAMAAQAPDTP
jgi:hypothetical protein